MEIVIESFQRWFNGNQLITGDTTNIVLGIILVVLFIVLIVMLTLISIQTLFWTRIGWFFEDVWNWIKRRGFSQYRFQQKKINHASSYERASPFVSLQRARAQTTSPHR